MFVVSGLVKTYIVVIGLGFIFACLFTGLLIPYLKKHQFKQYEREEGPDSHKYKTGTPSMGGVAIIAAVTVSSILLMLVFGFNKCTLIGLVMFIAHGLLGFKDDYLKAVEKKNDGMSPKQKILFQIILGAVVAVIATYTAPTPELARSICIPFIKHGLWINLGIFYYAWVIFVMVAFTNAVNLTDGLDGLASSVTTIVCITMYTLAVLVSPSGAGDGAIYLLLAGGCLGFLVYNHYPAKIFMGDTGSMGMGGMMAAVAIILRMEILLAIVGIIYVIEALSVVIQVGYYKKTKKRIFRMAPIHHHFELGGWSERKVVTMFSLGTLVVAALTVFAIALL